MKKDKLENIINKINDFKKSKKQLLDEQKLLDNKIKKINDDVNKILSENKNLIKDNTGKFYQIDYSEKDNNFQFDGLLLFSNYKEISLQDFKDEIVNYNVVPFNNIDFGKQLFLHYKSRLFSISKLYIYQDDIETENYDDYDNYDNEEYDEEYDDEEEEDEEGRNVLNIIKLNDVLFLNYKDKSKIKKIALKIINNYKNYELLNDKFNLKRLENKEKLVSLEKEKKELLDSKMIELKEKLALLEKEKKRISKFNRF